MRPTPEAVFDHLEALALTAVERLGWSVSVTRGDCDDGAARFLLGPHTELMYLSPAVAHDVPEELIIRKTVESLRSGGDVVFLGGLAEELSTRFEPLDDST